MNARKWLRENTYEDIADLIDLVIAEIKASGSKERRNWWAVLAGGVNGKPLVVNGHEFAVIRVAQIRQGKPITENAISRNRLEQPPDVIATKRWPRKRLPSKARPIATKKLARTRQEQVS
jgi:hypothetical protein